MWNGTLAQVQTFISVTGITYPVLRNAAAVSADYGLSYDQVYVVGGDGRVVYRNLNGWSTSEVQAAVDAALEDLAATDVPITSRDVTRLGSPTPNPFNPRTSMVIDVPSGEDRVSLTIYDARGRIVRRLLDGAVVVAGRTSVVWDGADDRGRSVPSGVYHFRLTSETATTVQKGVLVR